MGKQSKKRKNPGVGVDFRKVKHKIGKKLPKAQNETRTDFQARSINLPNQSITQDKAGAAVSERNLTLKELVSQLAHHNTSTRRDALTGLQQLLAVHPAEARRHTALLLESLAPRLSDGEASVRTALLTTLRTAVLPALGPSALSPFMPLLMAHVSAALTNLSADVRFDALAVLGAVTEAAPQLMGQQEQLGAALAHYSGLLSRANRGKSVKSQALTGLLKVVASLDRFLAAALTAPAGSNSLAAATAAAAAGDAGSSGSSQTELDGLLLLQGHRAASAPAGAAQLPSVAALLQLYCPAAAGVGAGNSSRPVSGRNNSQKQQEAAAAAEAAAADCSDASSSSRPFEQQVLSLLEVLFDCWSEAAPGSLSTAPETESAQVLVHMLSSTQAIMTHFSPAAAAVAAEPGNGSNSSSLQAAGSSGAVCPGFDTRRDQVAWLQQAAGVVLPRLTKAFPVTPPATQGLAVGLFDLLQRFNLLGMQLCAGFMAAGVVWPPPQQQKQHKQQQQQQWEQQQHMSGQQQQEWHTRLLEFMAGVLATGHCLPHLEQAATGVAAAAGNSSGKARSQQQQQSAPGAAPANSSLSSSSILVAVLQSLQQLLPQLVGPARQHILVAVGQLAAAAAAVGPRAGSVAGGGGGGGGGADSSSGLRVLSPAAAGAAGSNAVRSACLALQLQLLLQHLWRGLPQPTEEADVAAWLAAAPKFLYDLGSNKPRLSQMLLQLLFEAARLSVPGSDIEQQLQGLQPQLAALLVTALPAQAAAVAAAKQTKQQQQAAAGASSQAVRVLVGPLAELPPACQHTAFDTLAHLPQLTPALLKAVALSCRIVSYPDAAVQRLLDGVLSAAGSSMAPDVFVSFAATLLSPGPAAGYLDRASKRQVAAGFGRHQQTVDAVCRWVHCYGPVQDLLPLLAVPLLQQQQDPAAQESPQQASCLTYSLAALAALGAGCWVPSSAAAAAGTDPSLVAAAGLDGGRPGVPSELLSALPGVLAAYCLHRAAVTGSADAFAAEAAVEQSLRQLVLPLACALPCDSLLLPFMRQLVQQGLVQQQLRAVLQVLRVLLGCQGLRLEWVQHEGEVRPLLQQVEAAARQLAGQSGEGTALAAVEQLLTGLAVMCA